MESGREIEFDQAFGLLRVRGREKHMMPVIREHRERQRVASTRRDVGRAGDPKCENEG